MYKYSIKYIFFNNVTIFIYQYLSVFYCFFVYTNTIQAIVFELFAYLLVLISSNQKIYIREIRRTILEKDEKQRDNKDPIHHNDYVS